MKYNEKHELLDKGRKLEELLKNLNRDKSAQFILDDIFNKFEFDKHNTRVFICDNEGNNFYSNIDDVIYEMKAVMINLIDVISYQNNKIESLTEIINTLLNGIIKNKEDK